MRIVALLDTTISDTNLGNQVIVDSIVDHLGDILDDAFFIRVPSFDKTGPLSNQIIQRADFVFLCGGNVMSSHLLFFKPWRINLLDGWRMKGKVITVGVGWLRYKNISERWMHPDLYSKLVYRLALSHNFIHSVRDTYAKEKMNSMGFNAINTGCPSLWSISPTHCLSIPKEKGKDVVMTLTCYRPDVLADREMLSILRRHYSKIYFWPQQPGDIPYFRQVAREEFYKIEIIPPQLSAFDELLKSRKDLDYVGTRLHAYIRAVQHGRRAINVGVDDRAYEMKRDFHLTVVQRGRWEKLEQLVEEAFETSIVVPQESIKLWKAQFQELYNA